jgi:hypothetical protein
MGKHKDTLEWVVRKLHHAPCPNPNKHPDLPDIEGAILELFFIKYKSLLLLIRTTGGIPQWLKKVSHGTGMKSTWYLSLLLSVMWLLECVSNFGYWAM